MAEAFAIQRDDELLHIYISIFGQEIPTYGLLIAAGVILANLIALAYMMKYNEQDNLEDFLILEAYTFLGAFIGAKILYLIISHEEILWNKILDVIYFNKIMQGGFVFYGGLIGGIFFLYLGGKIHKLPAADYLRHYIFLTPFIHSFGRIGCYEAGCCYGIPYSGYGAVIYPENSLAPAGISLMPVQLIEAVFLMILTMAILFIQKHGFQDYTVEVYLVSYGAIRFLLEFFRFDEGRGKVWVFSVSQIISIFLMITGALSFKRRKKLSVT